MGYIRCTNAVKLAIFVNNSDRNMQIWEYTLYLTTTACLWSGKKPNGHLSICELCRIMFNNSS